MIRQRVPLRYTCANDIRAGRDRVIEQALVFMVAVSLPLTLVVEEIVRWRRELARRGTNRPVTAIRNPMIVEERHA